MPPEPDHLAELHRVLVEAADPAQRARAHVELGRHALGNHHLDLAVRHFREALLLDPRLEAARQALHALGEASRAEAPRGGRRGAIRSALRRVLGRTHAA